MSERVARALLAVAVRRWPVHLRDEMRQEWSAELHVLAEHGRPARMLRYAASLAAARPPRRPVTARELLAGTWRVTRLVLVAPLLAMALLAATMMVTSFVYFNLAGVLPFATALQLPLATLLTLGSAVLLARLGRRWTVPDVPTVPLVLAVTAPGFSADVLVNAASGGADKIALHTPAHVVFFVGLGAVLVTAARLARGGRVRKAWWVGVSGAVLVADLAVVLLVLRAGITPEEGPHVATAPVWLFTSLTDSGFGLPGLTGMQIFAVTDVVELDTLQYLAFTALALGTVIAAARRQEVPVGGEVTAPGPVGPAAG